MSLHLPPRDARVQYASMALARSQLSEALGDRADVLIMTSVGADLMLVTQFDRVSLADVPLSHRAWLAVLVKQQGTKSYLYWGVVPVLKIVHSQRTYVCLDRADFVDAIPDLDILITYEPKAKMPAAFNLDDMERVLEHRLAQYTKPDGREGTDEQRRWDRLGYELGLASVAQHAALDERMQPDSKKQAKEAWIQGEMTIARHRLSVEHITGLMLKHAPGGSVFQDMVGMDVTCVPGRSKSAAHGEVALLEHAKSKHGLLAKGVLYLKPALWHGVTLDWMESVHRANLARSKPLAEDNAHIQRMLSRFHVRMRGEAKPVTKAAASCSSPMPSVQAVGDIEDLTRVMPMCMRELAEEAFDPTCASHLKHEDRKIFYSFALGNGLDPATLTRAVVERFNGSEYPTRKVVLAVKNMHSYVRGTPDYRGFGCKKLQETSNKHGVSYCPYMRGSSSTPAAARIACHDNQNALLKRVKDPNPSWFAPFPISFTQTTIVARAAARSPSASTMDTSV